VKALVVIVLGAGAGLAYNEYSDHGIPLQTPERASRTEAMDWKLFVSGHRATIDEVREAVETGNAVIIDARGDRAYAAGHIPGALSLPGRDYYGKGEALLAGVAKDTKIITYCSGGTCQTSIQLAEKLRAHGGYTNVKAFYGGWRDWRNSGMTIEMGEGRQ
jgi:rhodanese-related sulfurtransferase